MTRRVGESGYLDQVSCGLDVVPQVVLSPGQLLEGGVQLLSGSVHLLLDQAQLHGEDGAAEAVVPLGGHG